MVFLSSRSSPPRVKVSDREITLDTKTLAALRRYFETQMTLEELAKELGLGSWEDAYELVKRAPAWLVWSFALSTEEAGAKQ